MSEKRSRSMDKTEDELDWIVGWLIVHGGSVDTLNQEFSDAFIKEFKVRFTPMPFGAHKCPELGYVMSLGARMGFFQKSIVGLTNPEVGFPDWVRTYSLPPTLAERIDQTTLTTL